MPVPGRSRVSHRLTWLLVWEAGPAGFRGLESIDVAGANGLLVLAAQQILLPQSNELGTVDAEQWFALAHALICNVGEDHADVSGKAHLNPL